MSLKQDLLAKMHELDIEPKRSLGQNFLIGEHVVQEIIQYVERRNPPFVIEVGPGLGALTERLIERNWPRRLVELDRKFAAYWRGRGEEVIEGDALKLTWHELQLPPETMLLSNLPYQIGARLVIELSLAAPQVSLMVLMFQREVAERLTASPRSKDYGFLTVVAQSYWNVHRVVDAAPDDFFPAPNVSSRVVALKRKEVDARLSQEYISFVKAAFQFRRKFMLKSFKSEEGCYKEIFRKLNISDTVRAEELSAENFQKIFLLKRSDGA